jgi:hypothetical protein
MLKVECLKADVEDDYPCMYHVVSNALKMKDSRLRKRYWFEQTFFKALDRQDREALRIIERKAEEIGIPLR